MPQILGIDYGTKKIGLAISDETNTIAGPLPVLLVKNDKEGLEGIKQIIDNSLGIMAIVVGLPLSHDLKPTQMSKHIQSFIIKLKDIIPPHIQITLINESLTTKMAEVGRSKKFKKTKSDSEAARILLQEYLNHLND